MDEEALRREARRKLQDDAERAGWAGRTSGLWTSIPTGSTGRSLASPRPGRARCRATSTSACSPIAWWRRSTRPVASGWRSNTIAVSDNQSQATPGMRASLISREVIADSIELMAHAHDFEALVCLVGCDKTTPAALMALARVDKPAVVLYGGRMRAGRLAPGGGPTPGPAADDSTTLLDSLGRAGARSARTDSFAAGPEHHRFPRRSSLLLSPTSAVGGHADGR